jgi:mRNA interferase HigB
VHVISKNAAPVRKKIEEDSTLEGPFSAWYKVATNAEWKNIHEVRAVYPTADFVDPFTVFNIRGGNYRLIVKIEYRWQMIFIKDLLSHDEYSKGRWK